MINAKAASTFLLDHWRSETRCEALPDELRPRSKVEAYAVQAFIEEESNSALVAWKIAATSVAGQKHIGVSGPLAGRYITERVVPSGSTVPFARNHMKVAEVEFAFRLGQDIAPRAQPFTEDEVFAAVAALHPAIEIPDSRYNRFEIVGEAQLIADNACAHWLAIGAAFPDDWRGLDLTAFEPIGRIRGKSETHGRGSNVLGSPRIAMTWFVNEMSALGITLREGQYVSTGTCVVPMVIAANDHIEGDFGAMGRISLTLGP